MAESICTPRTTSDWNEDAAAEEDSPETPLPLGSLPAGSSLDIDTDVSPLPPWLTLDRHGRLFYEMIWDASKACRPPVKSIHQKPVDPSFVQHSTDAAPPFYDFSSTANTFTLHHFKGGEFKGPNYFFIQNVSLLRDFYDLEYEMSKWYNEFFFQNEMFERKNWERIWIGGFYAAWIPARQRWLRAWVCERVYSEDVVEYKAGVYDVFIYLIDYGMPECIPRRYLLPLRQEDIQLPFVSYIGAIQPSGSGQAGPDDKAMTKEEIDRLQTKVEGKHFSGFVLGKYELADMPFQVLKLKLTPWELTLGRSGS